MIYKRGKVYWYQFIVNGRRIRESTKARNRAAALQVEADRRRQELTGDFVKHRIPAQAFDSFAADFLIWSQTQNKPRTHKRYVVSSKPLIGFLGSKKLNAITVDDIEQFKIQRKTQVTNSGANRDLACLRLMLNFAVRKGYLAESPFKVKLFKENPGNLRIVSYDEEELYLRVAHRTLRDVARVILETGMRPEEVFKMETKNVHERYVSVPEGKTAFARRTIPLTQRAKEVLQRRMSGKYVFPGRLDKQTHLTTVQKLHEKALKDAALQFRLYDLRHTYGSRMVMAGVDLPTLKELMGHSSITMTMRYVHPTPEHKMNAVLKFQQNQPQNQPQSHPSPS
jgi:integrase